METIFRRRMLQRRSMLLHCNIALILLAGCQIGDLVVYRDAGPGDGPMTPDAGTPRRATPRFSNGDQILTFLDGKRLVMDGEAIPTHPNGFDENENFGQATQCLHRVTMAISAGAFRVSTDLGSLRDAPNPEDVGTCDRDTPSGDVVTFDTTAALVEEVADEGRCFDITLTYVGFGQEGRGSISEDGETMLLELFFRDQAIGHRCADGDPGSPTITLNQEPFEGDAVQIYRIEE